MRFISLFSGIGGFDLGFERAGMECVAQVEFNKCAADALQYHWPKVPHYEDVRHVGKRNLPAADLICGGFPCQDVSVAGKRAGLAGERSGLWFEFLRIITECAPGWVVIENVPGLLSSNKGADFATVIHGLVERGYRVGWRVLDAQYFGLAQRRKRVFIVGSLTTALANPAQVLFERESRQWDTPPRRETRQGTATYAIKGAAIGRKPENGPQYGEISEDGASYTLNTSEVHAVAGSLAAGGAETFNKQRTDKYSEGSVGSTLSARDYKDAGDLVVNAVDVRSLKLGDEVSGTLQAKKTGGYSLNYINPVVVGIHAASGEDISPALTSEGHDGSEDGRGRKAFAVEVDRIKDFVETEDRIRAVQSDAKASTAQEHVYYKPNATVNSLDAAHTPQVIAFMAGQGAKAGSVAASEYLSPTLKGAASGTNQVPSVAYGIRTDITPKWAEEIALTLLTPSPSGGEHPSECITPELAVRRLTPIECERLQGFPDNWTDVDNAADSHRYKQLGNAIAVPVAYWIGKRIMDATPKAIVLWKPPPARVLPIAVRGLAEGGIQKRETNDGME